jgi:beta-hydroxylase
MHGLDRVFGAFSTVGGKSVHDPSNFSWTRTLEDNWPVIRDELDDILERRAALPSFHDIAEDALHHLPGRQLEDIFPLRPSTATA